MPLMVSVPAHLTVKLGAISVAGSLATMLTGASASRVLNHVGVSMGALASKTMVALLLTTVPVCTFLFGRMEKRTLPSMPGGGKPTVGSSGGRPVAGSREV